MSPSQELDQTLARDRAIWKSDIEAPAEGQPDVSGWTWIDFGHKRIVVRAWSSAKSHGFFDENCNMRSHNAVARALFSTEKRAQAALDYLTKIEPMFDEVIRSSLVGL